jgi:hypothetical protein
LIGWASPYKAYALDADGKRTPLRTHGIVVELRPGIEVEHRASV